MGLIAITVWRGVRRKSGRAVLSLVSFLTPIISHHGVSIFILRRALTMSRLLNGHPVSVQYELLTSNYTKFEPVRMRMIRGSDVMWLSVR